jgi:hypothetical protein
MSFKKNIKDLILDSWKYQYAEINDSKKSIEKKKPIMFFTNYQLILIVISIVFIFLSNKGFSNEFAGFAITGLSLFVGVFFTFVLTLYSKFQTIDFEKYKSNTSLLPIGVRLKNFYTKVTVLSLYTILLALICIVLISITLLFDFFKFDLSTTTFVINKDSIDFVLTLKSILIISYRGITMYFLLNFILIAVYLIGALYDFIISDYQKVKLKKD